MTADPSVAEQAARLAWSLVVRVQETLGCGPQRRAAGY